jgi:hypothetical protein
MASFGAKNALGNSGSRFAQIAPTRDSALANSSRYTNQPLSHASEKQRTLNTSEAQNPASGANCDFSNLYVDRSEFGVDTALGGNQAPLQLLSEAGWAGFRMQSCHRHPPARISCRFCAIYEIPSFW